MFRAGGTSLSGQSQTDGILVDVRRHWQRIGIEQDGRAARVQPGAVLGHVNRRLVRHGRRLGPDPASTDIACIGGVIANNSGGMRCGVHADSYRTLRSLTFVLANGAVIDTAAPDAEERFAAAAPELASGLAGLRDELRADPQLCERIERKFQIKNTTGYRLCAFLDADSPLEIFRRLLVGSEGTLAFVAEAVFETVALGRHTATGLWLFEDIDAAVDAVPELVAAGATATELMVAPTLIAAAWNMPGTPERWKSLEPHNAALLVELRGERAEELDDPERAAEALLSARSPLDATSFTREREHTEMLWHVREGMQGLLAAIRAPGVTMIIEDICVPPARVGEAAKDLQRLLGAHGFLPGVAGHASAGNLHFLLTPNFGEQADLDRYEAFMHDLVEMVVGEYDGSLKAEHGTGINMAPYVEREWGAPATEMMWRVKRLADPDGILAPGVVLTREAGAHLRNLKSAPVIEDVATQCIECGFCEPVCPSRDLTTTPRQRIALRREMARQEPGSPVLLSSARAIRVRRHRDVRRRRDVQSRLPGRHRHGRAGQAAAGARALGALRAHRARARAPLRHRGARGARRAASGARRRRPARSSPGGAGARRHLGRAGARLVGGDARPRSRPASRDEPDGGRRRVLPGVCQPHLRQRPRGRRRARRAPGARRGFRAGRPAVVDPRRRRRPLLRPAVELQGLRGRARAHGAEHRRGRGPLDGLGAAAARRRRELVLARPDLGRRAERSMTPPASGSSRSRWWTRSPGCTTRCCPRSMCDGAPRASPCILPAPPSTSGSMRSSRR